MEQGISATATPGKGIKLAITRKDGKEVARARLYILENDLHKRPFGFIEDVYVDGEQRGKGHGTKLVEQLIKLAKKQNCYKIICTSRTTKPKVHELYQKIGFKDWGKEFRMDLE